MKKLEKLFLIKKRGIPKTPRALSYRLKVSNSHRFLQKTPIAYEKSEDKKKLLRKFMFDKTCNPKRKRRKHRKREL